MKLEFHPILDREGETPVICLRGLVGGSQLMQPAVDRLARFQEGAFQVGEVILLTVMVCSRAGGTMCRRVASVGQSTFHQGEHVRRSIIIEEPPLAATGDVDR